MTRPYNKGFSMVEVLVTIMILMIGLLGLAGLQARALTTQVDSYQRAQALVLLKDMADRLDANRKGASCYVMASNKYLGTGATFTLPTSSACALAIKTTYDNLHAGGTPMTTATANALAAIALADLSAWNNALLGSGEVQGVSGVPVGAMIGARGCIYEVTAPAADIAAEYLVVVAWQGMSSTYAPDATTATSGGKCGQGEYKDRNGTPDERLHRVVTLPISIADLQ